ncbi:MAG: UPF0175 family protein [Planctomycetes bacterium]|nr:UPF0175 family protein [Planctomycetota bacterium]
MITPHPHFVVDADGRPTAVQVPVDEFRALVLAAFAGGRLGVVEAASFLGVTRPEFYALAAESGISTCTYTPASVEAELANL